ncbi:glycoside hydrolase family 3 protein [Shinella sp. DD12]|uniref:glycoside hydrolase family 3 protein n=1 Tax=Shinella sp. DD12 TaxID=1410620 RepID=UPI0003C53E96|nr:glycoside hydrolase family 3 N-terminal domain-containing protein [Shinella sp. DD12]EYR83772.1 beta-N-acetylglucosaminidase/beta-glucosidase [Shinella sp. DD12]
MIDDLNFLAQCPFNLDHDAIEWVRQTTARLSLDEQISQLFNIGVRGPTEGWADEVRRLKPGGVTRLFREGGDAELAMLDRMRDEADVPLLVSADLEGSRMSFKFGTTFPSPLAVAAANDLDISRRVAEAMAAEAADVGINWSFTPVLDINAAWRSAIVATRSYGSDPDRVLDNALVQMQAFQRTGIAACLKHWPGEGYDDRDQHTVTTINPLSMEDWENTFGRMYRTAIEAGAFSIMSAHIALPAFVHSIDPDAGIEAYRPASASALLNEELLRKRLGFNGLIVSDASEMAGLTSFVELVEAKVELLRNGCDMVLFTRDLPRDIVNVRNALETGYLPRARFEMALARVLGMKAALNLHGERKIAPRQARLEAMNSEAQKSIAAEATVRAPTLVKDVQNLFPISPQAHRRIYFAGMDVLHPIDGTFPLILPQLLRERGFEVTEHVVGEPISCEDHDLVLFAFADETLLCRNRIWLDWTGLTGHFSNSMKRPWFDIPTAMLSFGFPYYLYDAPRMPTNVNAYNSTEDMQRAVLACILGDAPFVGSSPVDPFCGLQDARF